MNQLIPTVSRKEAADMLSVSTRTLDRYIRQRKITPVKRGRNIAFNIDEIRKFQQKSQGAIPPKLNINEETFFQELRAGQQKSLQTEGGEKEGTVYKHLYEEASHELKKKEELLQGANYRVGQLEAKLQNMIPLLEYNRQKEETEKVKVTMEKTQKTCELLAENVQIEKFNKKIFTILFFMSIGLFPILLIIHLLSIS